MRSRFKFVSLISLSNLIEIEKNREHKIMSLIKVDLMTSHEFILVYIFVPKKKNSCNSLTKLFI